MNDELDDLFLEGGDELLNTKACSHCGDVIYLDQKIEWFDEENKIAKCPKCGEEIKVEV